MSSFESEEGGVSELIDMFVEVEEESPEPILKVVGHFALASILGGLLLGGVGMMTVNVLFS